MSRDSESVQFVAKSDFFMFLSFIIFLFFDIFNQILEKDAIFICALIRRTSYTMASFRSTLHKKKSWVYTESGNSRRLLFKSRFLMSKVHLFF